MNFYTFIACLVLLRLSELFIARKNERWLRANGAVEYGQGHYPFIVLLHTCFIISLIVEFRLGTPGPANNYLLLLYVFLLLVKAHVIWSLGKYWNTKIFRIESRPLIRSGLYRYIKHPNYCIVVAEIAVIPLIFQLYCTAVAFSVLNALMLYIRITAENKALK